MKKIALFVALSAFAFSLHAFDMGFNIDNASSFFYTEDPTLAQGDTATLWARFDVPDVGRLDVSGIYDILYTRVWSAKPANVVDVLDPYRFDVGILRWSRAEEGRVRRCTPRLQIYGAVQGGLRWHTGGKRWMI